MLPKGNLLTNGAKNMNTDELLRMLKVPGRYLVYVLSSGEFVVVPLLSHQIVITPESRDELIRPEGKSDQP
ncbi:hypothetical protein D6T51_07925 [Salmonella enterica subsp. enterica serovar Muenchen]|nr:hypothetical protein [Salmonella enterica subsp. enterica serovar Muenchen]